MMAPRFAAVLVALLLAAGPATAADPAKTGPGAKTGTGNPAAAAGPLGKGGGSGPVDIQADNAIEWHQDQKAYVARGHATATRGTATIHADVLTAYYRETKDKGADVYRMTAEGNVHIVTPNQQVFGEHGVWDNDRQIGVVTGTGLKLVTATEVVTARDSFEYYDATKLAVARGDAIAVRKLDRLRADTMVAQFKEGAGGSLEMQRLDGIGAVVITTPNDVALCQRVMYSVPTDIAVLVGGVKITRGDNQVNGDAAEMNMKTHVNRVLSNGRRVEGLLVPKTQDQAGGPGVGKGAKPPKGTKATPSTDSMAAPAAAPAH
jgi:lipopolysaccharide export system protein LptA